MRRPSDIPFAPPLSSGLLGLLAGLLVGLAAGPVAGMVAGVIVIALAARSSLPPVAVPLRVRPPGSARRRA